MDDTKTIWTRFLNQHHRSFLPPDFPIIVTLCGSTRFYELFQRANYELTMAGKIVLSVGHYPHSTKQAHGELVGCTEEQKVSLDELHKRKIDLSDEVLVLNELQPWCPACQMTCLMPSMENLTPCCAASCERRPYVGSSTRSEIEYAMKYSKVIRYLHPQVE